MNLYKNSKQPRFFVKKGGFMYRIKKSEYVALKKLDKILIFCSNNIAIIMPFKEFQPYLLIIFFRK